MIIPYNTDAPVYHPPIATVGLILLNAVVFFATLQHPALEPWMLSFGQGIHPQEWITSLFLHAGLDHLIGNMLFLWVFGLVIEGKIGWWKFLLVYLALGACESAAAQIIMLNGEGFALGASGAIYGVMAMSLIWAPSNDVHCIGFWGFHGRFFDIPIMVFAAIYVGLQLLFAWLSDFEMSSAMLHLCGALPGLALGGVMIKAGFVDCEQWDIFALCRGKQGEPRNHFQIAQPASEVAHDRAVHRATAMALFEDHLSEGRAGEAAALHQTVSQRLGVEWKLTPPQLLALIKLLHQQKLWVQSVEPMTEYLRLCTDAGPKMRLKLAQILLTHAHRPARTLRLLQEISPDWLSPDLQQVHCRLVQRAVSEMELGELQLEE